MRHSNSYTSVVAALNFPWAGNSPFISAISVGVFATLVASPLAVGAVLHHHWGTSLLPVAIGGGFAAVFLLVSLGVGRAVVHLGDDADCSGASRSSDCKVASGAVSSPGRASIHGDTLVLAPLVGAAVRLPLHEVTGVRETRWFNGSLLFGGARGFWLTTIDRSAKRVGFAVQDADGWRAILRSPTRD